MGRDKPTDGEPPLPGPQESGAVAYVRPYLASIDSARICVLLNALAFEPVSVRPTLEPREERGGSSVTFGC
jgi:hypothetical protein